MHEAAEIDGDGAGIKAAAASAREPRLLDQVRGRLRAKHYSLRTEKAYVWWIRRYILANGKRHPRELDGVVVERFLTRLATVDHVSASTQSQALSAILFLYKEVLGITLPWMDGVVRAKQPRHVIERRLHRPPAERADEPPQVYRRRVRVEPVECLGSGDNRVGHGISS